MKGYWKVIKNVIMRSWLWFLAATIISVVGGLIGFFGSTGDNPFIIFIGFGFMAGGYFLFKRGFSSSSVRVIGSDKPDDIERVALVINERSMAFEPVQESQLKGFAQKNINDLLFYHVNTKVGDELSEFTLPEDDEALRTFQPEEMANVISMTSYKKAINYSSTIFQKIPAAIIGGIIILEIIGLIAME